METRCWARPVNSTDEIEVSPPFLKLQPSDSYNLRVVRINPEPVSGEKLIVLLMSYQNRLIAKVKAARE